MTNRFKHGFTSQHNETRIDALPVTGTVPDWLAGTLLRNAPGQFEVGDDHYRHWFDGLSMLHAFTFNAGSVGYANRFLRSRAYEENNRAGKILYGEFATDPCRGLFGRVMSVLTAPQYSGNANVSITKLADDYLAQTEYPMSVRFDPQTLETLGVVGADGTSGQITIAHPHMDFERGRSYTYLLDIGRNIHYRLYQHDGHTNHEVVSLPVQTPAYMHSFGMSERYLILAEYPLRLPSPFALLLSGKPFIQNYRWDPEQGAAFIVIDKDTGEVVTRAETDPYFAFHHVNAFERDGELIVDIAAYDDAAVIDNLYLDVLRDEGGYTPIDAQLRRYRVPLDGGRATYETVSTVSFELPRIDYRRHNGRHYRYAYGAGTRAGTQDFTNQLVKIDTETGDAHTWFVDGFYPGEPVFVPHPGGGAEDAGVVLSIVLDSASNTSFLLVLDAASFDEVARASVPQHIPFGFHGSFFRA